jgi:hypothetical protein
VDFRIFAESGNRRECVCLSANKLSNIGEALQLSYMKGFLINKMAIEEFVQINFGIHCSPVFKKHFEKSNKRQFDQVFQKQILD